MASIAVPGARNGGIPARHQLQKRLGKGHDITLINSSSHSQFTPSDPWRTQARLSWATRRVQVALVRTTRPH